MDDSKKKEYNLANNKKKILYSLSQKLIHTSKRTMQISAKIIETILSEKIDEMRKLSQKGLPDDLLMIRALVWKISLGYLPIKASLWENVLKEKRKSYQVFKSQFEETLKTEYNTQNYKSRSLLESIAKDVNRTHLQFSFFFQPTSKTTLLTSEELHQIFHKRQNCTIKNTDDLYKINTKETHAEVLARILFILSKLVPELSYHQGMNELLAPIYYCFSYDKLYIEETEETIEADAFWCFYQLINDLRSSFDVRDVNNIESKAAILGESLKIIDFDLWAHITSEGLHFELFAGRWFVLLFAQEFEINDVLRLWDLVFSTDNKYYFIFYLALAFLELKRDALVKKDLPEMMMEIQTFDDVNIDDMIKIAIKLNNEFKNEIDGKIRLVPFNYKENLLRAENRENNKKKR